MALTKLTKDMRAKFVGAALKSTFEPRFDALKKKLFQLVKKMVAEQHPHFVRAHADKNIRQYMAISESVTVKLGGVNAVEPNDYVIEVREEYVQSGHASYSRGIAYVRPQIENPAYQTTDTNITDEALVAEYKSIWADYFVAQETLTSAIAAYTTVENFSTDFPTLVQFLPAMPSPVRALAVRVEDVTEKLASIGIPAGEAA